MTIDSTLTQCGPEASQSLAPLLGDVSRASAVRASRFWERWLARRFIASLGSPDVGLELWDGFHIGPSPSSKVGLVRLCKPSVLPRLIWQGSVAFGEAYSEGVLEIDGDVVQVLVAINRAMARSSPSWLSRLRDRAPRTRHRHSLAESQSSVFHHYDIGNDFYRRWLDEQLVYTCAYYSSPDLTLEEAQIAKLDHVCRKLRLQPNDTVLEAGCGWGALALHMARKYGVRVRALNLSREQLAFARERAKTEGLADRVQFVEDDYRQTRGRFDAFVSVGMLEHVGIDNFAELGRLIGRSLKPNGRGLIHSIGRNVAAPLDAWTDKHIFPGAEPPSLSQMMPIFEAGRFSVLDVENLRLHYAKTLDEWRRRFEASAQSIERQFDSHFVRMWRLYLCASIAAFLSGDLQLFQVTFSRAESNDLPWTRADLYRPQETAS
jgi:cyclopropane-fatty-acyl-phospholipid synthase